ncbi:MAG: phosphatidylserine decarboxylase [Candidatus Kapaibacterium sp.]
MLTKYGTDNIVVMLALSVVLIAAGFIVQKDWAAYIFWAAGGLLALFTFWFFRDPGRAVPEKALNNDEYIVSPADGEVIEVVEEYEEHFLKSNSKRISIFLSPLDVHVNRIPVSGIVKFYEYHTGNYLVAYHPKASELNEHTKIGVENGHGKVFFKQIVGVLARRLVSEINTGDTVRVGERFGMMKFGSRMDVVVSPDDEILVKKGERVVAGETIIGMLKSGKK